MSFCDLIAHFSLLLNNIPPPEYTSLFYHSPIEGHHASFLVLAFINKAALKK